MGVENDIKEKYPVSPVASEDQKIAEMKAVREKLSEIHNDIKKIIERSNKLYFEAALESSRREYSSTILNHLLEDIETGLERNMVKKCPEKINCTSAFTSLLQQNAELIKHGKVDDNLISNNRKKLDELRCGAPFSKCEQCFSEVSSLFTKQVNLMRSMRIYSDSQEHKSNISSIKTDTIMSEILEPISNNHRLEILKAVSFEMKSFSAFSELTSLRGGNLLFHLQKLLDNGLILQMHERGDYMITDKGLKILQGLQEIYSSLQNSPIQNTEDILQEEKKIKI
ncbi:Transcriptional regulator, ArsR family [Methanosarcina barkeri str. Wiesmoor]|uniref:Transcriptional regulator, ArsR family n=2 Tax=Methanosarcina barkeri TaxID=2208 RepID=A0A0E3QMH8_METBA|nr:helix-turn-helix transcriptional regulator [Methanosarcina barkeri]AKB50935.1 Transcriptional regulator, ArsR family [Methanosarcina barkeri str. Wiesmoor]